MLQPRARSASPLAARGADRDGAAFSQLYHRHHQALYRYCLSILRQEQDAQDVLQNTMVKAHQALAKAELDFEPRPWLFRVAHNECISLLRRRRQTTELTEDLPAAATTEERHAEREGLRQLAADLAELPERQRSALVLRELSGLSHDEISQVLGLRPSIVKSTIFEARSALLEYREGREMACATVRAALSDGDKRVLRARRHRAHLRDCAGCRAFKAGLLDRPAQLAALAPPLPAAAALALLHQLVSGAGSGASTAAIGAGSSATVGTGSAASAGLTATSAGSSVFGGVTAKLAVGAGLAALAAGGTAAVHSVLRPHHAAPSVAARQAGHPAAARAAQARDAARRRASGGADLPGGSSTGLRQPRAGHSGGASLPLAPAALKARSGSRRAANGSSQSSLKHQTSSARGTTRPTAAPQASSHRHANGSRTSGVGSSGRSPTGPAGQPRQTRRPRLGTKPSRTTTRPLSPVAPLRNARRNTGMVAPLAP